MSAKAKAGLVHFRHYFHPAGHGTFFTGHIRKTQDRQREDDFLWVYDCGSKRPSHLRGLIDQLQLGRSKRIDMVCISHFDSDHVCGLELLLKKTPARVLVLPYLSLEARIRLASLVEEEQAAAHQLAAFTVDPSRFLKERGLGERFDRIVLVQGGGQQDGVAEPNQRIDDSDRFENEDYLGRIPTRPLGEEAFGYLDSDRIAVAEHHQPWSIGGVYELVFYNTALVDEATPESGVALDQIAAEVGTIVKDYDLCATTIPRSGWLEKLKGCYAKHFGSTAKRKNDISLCALGRPLVQGAINRCGMFPTHPNCQPLEVRGQENVAVLLTGDISLNRQEIVALQCHVGAWRWNQVRVMQIPHHGSRGNWEPGLSALCVHEYSVVCAPPSKDHPHDDVVCDLSTRNLFVATYNKAVSFDFHVG